MATLDQEDLDLITAAVLVGLGALEVTVSSPVAASGVITIYQADDYATTEARPIRFSVADASHLFGLTAVGAEVRLHLSQATWPASSVTQTAAGYDLTFEVTAAQSAALTMPQPYQLKATLANAHVITLAEGSLTLVQTIPVVSES